MRIDSARTSRSRYSDEETRARFRAYRQTADRRIRNELVENHRNLARAVLRGFDGSDVPDEDLLQVALLGLVRAADRYDPDYGPTFAAFAAITIRGDLRRHFRDKTWAVHVNRGIKDRFLLVRAAYERLSHELQRSPTVAELAVDVGCTIDETVEALDVGQARTAGSLLATDGSNSGEGELSELARTDERFDARLDRVVIHQLLDGATARERVVLHLRFFEEWTQREIAECVGVSQVHISRILRSSLERLTALKAGDGERQASA